MSNNPENPYYASASAPGAGPHVQVSDGETQLKTAGIILIIAGSIRMLFSLLDLGFGVLALVVGGAALAAEVGEAEELMQTRMGFGLQVFVLVIHFLSTLVAGLIIYGAIRMVWKPDYKLAMAGAICGLIPTQLSLCCCFGWPLTILAGIFALITLNRADVKEMFATLAVQPTSFEQPQNVEPPPPPPFPNNF